MQKLFMRLAKSSASWSIFPALAAVLLALAADAQAQGQAEVRGLSGTAVFSPAGGQPAPLKVGMSLPEGAVIQTGQGAAVDIFLGEKAGVARLVENTTVGLTKLGAETELDLREGTLIGLGSKAAVSASYQLRLPNGVAAVEASQFRAHAKGFLVLLDGTIVFVYVPPGGEPVPYTLKAPKPVYFSPIEGIRPAPSALVNEIVGQSKARLKGK